MVSVVAKGLLLAEMKRDVHGSVGVDDFGIVNLVKLG